MTWAATSTRMDDTVSRPAIQSMSAGVSALDVWAFALPALSFIEITVVGQLIVSEILALAMLPWLWGARDRPPLPRWFVVLWAGWLLGQIVTDLVVRSAFADFARGWAAIVFTITDFAAILILVSTARRARLFALGLLAGGALGYLLVPGVGALADPWKFEFAVPVGLVLAAGLAGSLGERHRWLTVGAFAAFGALNLVLGFRSLGGVSLLTTGYFVIGMAIGRQKASAHRSMLRSVVGLACLAIAVWGTLQLYDAAASQGVLGADAQTKYGNQSGSLGVVIGGRSEVLASSQAIIDSPILGHGSWPKDPAYVYLLYDRLSSLDYNTEGWTSDLWVIPTHSYLTQAWVWAGLLGGVFWLGILGIAFRLLADSYQSRVESSSLIVFSTMLLLWNMAFSGYGAGSRMLASYGIALCLMGLRSVRGDWVSHPPGKPSTDGSRYLQPEIGDSANSRRATRNLGPAPYQRGMGARPATVPESRR